MIRPLALYAALTLAVGLLVAVPDRSRQPGAASADPADAAAADQGIFVAPNGAATHDGTRALPLDLATALSAKSPAKPGDTVWLRGGTYHGTFASYLTGTQEAPIVVRSLPGEWAVIDSAPSREPALHVRGAWATFRDFELTNSDPLRWSNQRGSGLDINRGTGVDAHGPHLAFINLVIHDLAVGMGLWGSSTDTEAYGNIIYYNGWRAEDRSHGHGIYTQSQAGVRRLTDNVIFSQFSHGIHAYGSDAAYLDNIQLVGNISFNNGALDGQWFDRNILVGGGRRATKPVVNENYTYYDYRPGRRGGDNNLGYDAGCDQIEAKNNYWAHLPSYPLTLQRCAGVITGNVMIGPVDARIVERYPQNTYLNAEPTETKWFVRPNAHERGRAHVVVYNWDLRPQVLVDVASSGLRPREAYEVRDVQDLKAPPIASGIYTGEPIAIPLARAHVAAPIGDLPPPPHSGPKFGVFLLTRK